MSGLFATFNVAKRGMAVQQKSIDVTSHNIANANTPGYSRQRALIETTKPFGMPSLNRISEPGQLGTGSQIKAIERFRDAFLDYQTRVESSTLGQYNTRSKLLGEVESIFNEPSDTGLSTNLGKFFDSWQQLSKQPESSNARTVVVQQASSLADDLNHTYKKLMELKSNVQKEIKNTVVDVNASLAQMDLLNQQIVGVNVSGNRANDLMDKRDLLLDELSLVFNITVEDKRFDGIDLKPVDSAMMPDPYIMKSQDVGNGNTFSYVESILPVDPNAGNYTVTYYKYGDESNDTNKITLNVSMSADEYRQMEEGRVLWTDKNGMAIDKATGDPIDDEATVDFAQLALFTPSNGNLKGYASFQKDIDDYMDQLNKLAKALAFSLNAVHSGIEDPLNPTTGPSRDEVPFFVNGDIAKYQDGDFKVTNIDEILAGEKNINALNIAINKEIFFDPMEIKTRKNDDKFSREIDNNIDGESDGSRALAIAQLRDKLMTIQAIGIDVFERKDLFDADKGGNKLLDNGMNFVNNISGMKMDNYFKDTIDRIGIQCQEAQRMVSNQSTLLNNFEESRASISGVSLDEEMANLIQFQHAYQANAKIVATIDQLLDVVVNGLKR